MSDTAIQTRLWSREEYDRLVSAGMFHPEERLELIEGEILQMSLQGSAHATAVSLVENALRKVFSTNYVVRVQMPLALESDSEPEPDIAIVVGSPRDYRYEHPHTAELIVEVADSTLGYDRERKDENLCARRHSRILDSEFTGSSIRNTSATNTHSGTNSLLPKPDNPH